MTFTLTPPRDYQSRLADLYDTLRRMIDPSPFAIWQAVLNAGLSVTEIGSRNLDALVDEAQAQRGAA